MEQQRYSEAEEKSAEKKPLAQRESDNAHQHETNRNNYSGNSGVHRRNPERPRMRIPLTLLHG